MNDMYRVKKRLEISAAHSLKLSYESKCENLHGHNWIIDIFCQSKELNEDGMVVDFSLLKSQIQNDMDHKNLNEVFDFNTTAENLAKWICDNTINCYRVDVQESENNIATYEKD